MSLVKRSTCGVGQEVVGVKGEDHFIPFPGKDSFDKGRGMGVGLMPQGFEKGLKGGGGEFTDRLTFNVVRFDENGGERF